MKSVQMNTRVPKDVKDWIDQQAKAIDRDRSYWLTKLIRPMMKGISIHTGTETQISAVDTHKQQSLIPKLDKTAGFDEFWEAYPKKKAKADALKSWTKGECWKDAGNIITDVSNRVKVDPSWSDKQFVPNGATYLNGKRWEDEIFKQDNRPKFQQQNDALRDELFGGEGETYEHE